jgi:4-hydroxy-tetrahydrodipicolinate synthase
MSDYITGATTALITPFKNGALDEATFAKLVQRQINNGIDAVCPVGTTGESATLSYEEDRRCIEIAVEVCKGTQTKVLAGAGSNATHEAIEMAKHAQKAGADAIFSVSPYYNKPDQRGLLRHFTAVADATPLPLVLYDIPGRTAAIMHVDTIAELAQIPQIVGVKDATGDLAKALDVAHATADANGGFALWSGADEVNLPLLAAGAFGVISVAAHLVGPLIAEMIRVFPTDPLRARELQLRCMPLHRALFAEPSPAPLKAGLAYKGLPAGPVRAPLADASEAVTQRIQAVLDALTDTV